MTGLISTSGSLLWYALCLGGVALIIGQMIVMIRALRYRRDRWTVLAAACSLVFGFCLFVILMDCAQCLKLDVDDLSHYMAFQLALFELPWLVYAVPEVLCAMIMIAQLREDRRFRSSHVTPDAIHQGVDLLPEGIAVSAPDGTVLLANLKMAQLCRALTGSILSDAGRFREKIHEAGEAQGGQYLVKYPNDEVWLFTEKQITADGRQYDQLTAAEVTERYRITEELRQKNAHLQDLQRRMKAVSDLSGDMFVAQEEAAARVALHNELGQVLLMGRHCLEHPESADAGMVYMLTKQMNDFFLGEAEELVQKRDDELRHAILTAKSIGVAVVLRGELPETSDGRLLLARAIRECAANTVKHAEGDRLNVEIAGNGFTITNNGAPPRGAVAESGGLLALRRSIEAAGGTMTVQSAPEFRLTIEMPNE